MVEITNEITNVIYVHADSININKDIWDYAGIIGTAIAPLIAIVFSIWNNLQIKKLRYEDLQRETETQERAELRYHYQDINKFIDEQLSFLPNMSNHDFTNMIIKLQSLMNKCGMISHSTVRDRIVYYISTYIEVTYFLLTDFNAQTPDELLSIQRFFLNSLKEFDMPLINKEHDFVRLRIAELSEELRKICNIDKHILDT